MRRILTSLAILCLSGVLPLAFSQAPDVTPKSDAPKNQEKPKKKGLLQRMNDKIDQLNEKLDDKPKSAPKTQAPEGGVSTTTSARPDTTAQPTKSVPDQPQVIVASGSGKGLGIAHIGFNAPLAERDPEFCITSENTQWQCVQTVLAAGVQDRQQPISKLYYPGWPDIKFSGLQQLSYLAQRCGTFVGVWRTNRAGTYGQLEYEKCLGNYVISFSERGHLLDSWVALREIPIIRSGAEEDIELLKQEIVNAAELLQILGRGNVAEAQRYGYKYEARFAINLVLFADEGGFYGATRDAGPLQ